MPSVQVGSDSKDASPSVGSHRGVADGKAANQLPHEEGSRLLRFPAEGSRTQGILQEKGRMNKAVTVVGLILLIYITIPFIADIVLNVVEEVQDRVRESRGRKK